MESPDQLAARCTVEIHGGGRFLGSGFLIAAGEVLTCAHVVAGHDADELTVRCAGAELATLTRLLIPAEHGPDATYASPDLGLLTVPQSPDQPCVLLGESPPRVASTVVCKGFSKQVAGTAGTPAPDSVLLQIAGASGTDLVRVQQGEISEGLSGSLVLDLDTQRVCGMVKASRDKEAVRGGWIVPVSVIIDNVPGIAARNAQGHPAGSQWREQASRRAEFTDQIFRSAAPLQIPEPPRDPPPSWWLDPRHRVANYQDRPELGSLLSWAVNDDPQAPIVKLAVGPGGTGKTRLAVELATRLAAQGWIAGLLTPDDADRLPAIADALPNALAHGHQVFLAMDYAEGLGSLLTRFLARLPGPDQGKLRVLLLARFAGWWTSVMPSGVMKYLIDQHPLELGPLSDGPDAAVNRFAEAVQDYRQRLLSPEAASRDAPLPASLAAESRRHSAAIKCHALALVSVLHERETGELPQREVAWTDPLARLVAHERRHLLQASRGLIRSAEHHDYRPEGHALLTPTLVPAYSATEATAAIGRMPGLAEYFTAGPGRVAQLLRDLYPSDAASSLRWWSPLPLDRLGETLLAEVLKAAPDDQSAAEILVSALGAEELEQAIQGLTVTARVNADPGTPAELAATVEHCLTAVATADKYRLLPALLVADRLVPPGRRTSERLMGRLGPGEALNLAQALSSAPGRRGMLEAGLQLLDHAQDVVDADQSWVADLPEAVREEFARLLDRGAEVPVVRGPQILIDALRARLLTRLDRAEEATNPAERATRYMRVMWQSNKEDRAEEVPAAGSMPRRISLHDDMILQSDGGGLADIFLLALNAHADVLVHLDRLEEAAQVRSESAAVAVQEAESGSGSAWQAAHQLYELAEVLSDLGQDDNTEVILRRAAEYIQDPDGSPLSADILTLHAVTLGRLSRPAEAGPIAAEAIRRHRNVASRTGDYRHLVAASRELAHLLDDRPSQSDALADLRYQALRNPASAMPAFVTEARHEALSLARRGQREAGMVLMDEALRQARRLASDAPDTYRPTLANALCLSVGEGLSPDGHRAMAEAIDTYRDLVERAGMTNLRADLALAMMQDAVLFRDEGEPDQATRILADAIERLRLVMTDNPWRTAAYLSTALILRSETERRHGDCDQAVKDAREAIDIEIARTDDQTPRPADHLPQAQRCLLLALVLQTSGRAAQGATAAALASLAEARALARDIPAEILDDSDVMVAGGLGMYALQLGDAASADEALGSLHRAVRLLRDRADANPARTSAEPLLQSGIALVLLLKPMGRPLDTARAMIGLMADCARPLRGGNAERRSAALLTGEVLDVLPEPEFVAESLQVLVALMTAWREAPDMQDAWQFGVPKVMLAIKEALQLGLGQGSLSDEDSRAAALEIDACERLLEEQAPGSLGVQHAEALGVSAGLVARHDREYALAMNTRALDLYTRLASTSELTRSMSYANVLVLQGVLLTGDSRHEEAVMPLERALTILIAAGASESQRVHRLLRSAVPTLANAYDVLAREADKTAMASRLQDAGLIADHPQRPNQRQKYRPTEHAEALRAAAGELTSDLGRGIETVRQVMHRAARDRDYVVAWSACGVLAGALRSAGRMRDLPALADRQIGYGKMAGAGAWSELFGRVQQLEARRQLGVDDQTVLTEAAELLGRAERLPAEPTEMELTEQWRVREDLWRTATAAAMQVGRWAEAIAFSQTEAASCSDRGAPAAEVADAEFGAVSALMAAGRLDDAEQLLDRCEVAFSGNKKVSRIGLVLAAKAELQALRGDLRRAVDTSASALAWLYRSGDAIYIQRAHQAHADLLIRADRLDECALGHILAAGVLADLLGKPVDVPRVTAALTARAGESPASADALRAIVGRTAGVHFGALADRLADGKPAAPARAFDRVIREARSCQGQLFEEWARHRMEWDPVFAGIALAQQGNVRAARAVRSRLSSYSGNASWSQLAQALALVFRQRPGEAVAMPLDGTDQILLRRCLEVLAGSVQLRPALADAIPIAELLRSYLYAVQTSAPSSSTARMLAALEASEAWRQLAGPARMILAGNRNPQLTDNLSPGNAAIISTLLGLLATS